MRKLLVAVELSFLVGCGGDLVGRVSSSNLNTSNNPGNVSLLSEKCPFTFLVSSYDLTKVRVQNYGLKTDTMKRMFDMAEDNMNKAKKFYFSCDNNPDFAFSFVYGFNALNWMGGLALHQQEEVMSKLPK